MAQAFCHMEGVDKAGKFMSALSLVTSVLG